MKKKTVKNPYTVKPMPDVHAKADDSAGGMHGPGLNQKKPFTDYSKKGK